ncbi:MAG: hypothetical protein QGH52_06155, partial [Prochlorococcaceae cyanobacterium ETNP1_MAG_8]|nr:hypothetical protein [Prochlorococcaceae cyanobacterium ETNP1_MAG_8]
HTVILMRAKPNHPIGCSLRLDSARGMTDSDASEQEHQALIKDCPLDRSCVDSAIEGQTMWC